MAASIAQTPDRLSRKHAVRCQAFEEFSVEQYVIAIAELVGEENVIAASRMNKSVVIFLSSLRLVELAVMSGIVIDSRLVQVEEMVKPAKKVIISNVPPFIPNAILAEELSDYGRIVGNFRTIPLGCKSENLKHVQSFRRQVHLLLRNDNINGLLRVNFEGHIYTLYITTDEMRCFGCNQLGHLRKNCPNQNIIPIPTPAVTETTDNSGIEKSQSIGINDEDRNKDNKTTDDKVEKPTRPTANQSQSREANETTNATGGKNHNTDQSTVTTEQHSETTEKSMDTDDTQITATDNETTNSETDNTTLIPNEPSDPKSSDEERVRTPPSTPADSLCTKIIQPSHSSNPSVQPTNPQSPTTPPLLADTVENEERGLSDNMSQISDSEIESIASDVSEVPYTNETSLISQSSLLEFLDDIKGSKKILNRCLDFCTDTRILYKSLKKLRCSDLVTSQQKARIHKINMKLLHHLKLHGNDNTTPKKK